MVLQPRSNESNYIASPLNIIMQFTMDHKEKSLTYNIIAFLLAYLFAPCSRTSVTHSIALWVSSKPVIPCSLTIPVHLE